MTEQTRFLVVEYLPDLMDDRRAVPSRIDGHYASRADAENVARFWAEQNKHPESRIAVAEVLTEAKRPASWGKPEARP